MNFFLKLKHWQIFLLFFGTPIILLFLSGFNNVLFQNDFLRYILPILAGLSMIFIYLGWLWTIGNINRYLNSDTKKEFSIFKFLFRATLILGFIILPILRTIDNNLFIIKILRFLTFINFLFCIYLISIALQGIEKQKFGQINNLVNDFFLIWIMPIGIWFIQPRLNKIAFDNNIEDKIPSSQHSSEV
jgi:hypothetical protein